MKGNGCNEFLRFVKLKKKKEYRDGTFGGCKVCGTRKQQNESRKTI